MDILENKSWDEISDAIKDGTFSSYASVGDTKSFEINGKIYHAEVVSINDGSGKAGKWYPDRTVDFITKELYETRYHYNLTDTNTGGFPDSMIRGTLENVLYPLLPEDLRDVIIKKSHSYSARPAGTMDIYSTKLWLPTYYEISGKRTTHAHGETNENNKKYTLSSLIKTRNGESSAGSWWLGSKYSRNLTCFWDVYSSGSVHCYSEATNSLGVPICFRIGEGSEEDKDINILDTKSWKEISDAIKDGTFSNFASVGDTKSFVMNGMTYHAEVVSINDGTGEAAQWYPNKTVDFITKELYEITYPYNSTNTNAGGFPCSALRGTLENTLYPLLPSDLKDVIVAKSHSYNIHTCGFMGTDSTKLWLPTFYEIYGTTHIYAPGETASNNKAYTLASTIKKRNGQTSAYYWWLGSLISGYLTYFWRVKLSGYHDIDNASSSWGVPICFRIGQS